jgi:hypothetical protein
MGRLNRLLLGFGCGSPGDGSSHKTGEKWSQNKSSELRNYGENRVFHGSSLTLTNLGMRFFLRGMFQGWRSCRVRMLGEGEIAVNLVMVTEGGESQSVSARSLLYHSKSNQ